MYIEITDLMGDVDKLIEEYPFDCIVCTPEVYTKLYEEYARKGNTIDIDPLNDFYGYPVHIDDNPKEYASVLKEKGKQPLVLMEG